MCVWTLPPSLASSPLSQRRQRRGVVSAPLIGASIFVSGAFAWPLCPSSLRLDATDIQRTIQFHLRTASSNESTAPAGNTRNGDGDCDAAGLDARSSSECSIPVVAFHAHGRRWRRSVQHVWRGHVRADGSDPAAVVAGSDAGAHGMAPPRHRAGLWKANQIQRRHGTTNLQRSADAHAADGAGSKRSARSGDGESAARTLLTEHVAATGCCIRRESVRCSVSSRVR